jgi:hypothetical protein
MEETAWTVGTYYIINCLDYLNNSLITLKSVALAKNW